MDVTASNIANAETTRGADGGPYKKQSVVFETDPRGPGQIGVRVQQILQDQNPPRLEYDPQHPDANADGYVAKPHVDVAMEYVDAMEASRAYQLNAQTFATTRSMIEEDIALLKGS